MSAEPTDVASAKLTPRLKDHFEAKYLLLWAMYYLLLGFVNVVLDHYWIWHDACAFLLFVLTIIVGIYWFVRNCWRKGLSVLLALPLLWSLDYVLSLTGVDFKQRSFWLAYPYYISKIEKGNVTNFKWAENGYFLGGGWEYVLYYDPTGYLWSQFPHGRRNETTYLIGTSNKHVFQKLNSNDCEFRNLRMLGGDWYLQSNEYGDGIFC